MQINPCPKCGRLPNVILYRNEEYYNQFDFEIICYLCGQSTGRCASEDEAVTKWNELTKGETK